MEQVKIVKIYRSLKDKQGNLLKTKDGREYEKVAIQTEKYGEQWLDGFGNKANVNWKEGQTVDVTVSEREYQGKRYLNFSMPNVWDEIRDLKLKIAKLEGAFDKIGFDPKAKSYPEEEDEPIRPEDLPF